MTQWPPPPRRTAIRRRVRALLDRRPRRRIRRGPRDPHRPYADPDGAFTGPLGSPPPRPYGAGWDEAPADVLMTADLGVPGRGRRGDPVDPRPRIGPLGGITLWVAGVPRGAVPTRSERLMYSATGQLVLIVATAAGALMTTFLYTIAGTFSPVQVLVGVAWGLVILAVDRSILALRVQRRAAPPAVPAPGRRGRRTRTGPRDVRWIAYTLRVALALVVAVIVSEIAMLQIFHREIARELDIMKSEQTASLVVDLQQKQKDSSDRIRAQLGLPGVCDDVRTLEKQLQRDQDQFAAETKGIARANTTGRTGYGPVARRLEQIVAADQARLTQANRVCDQAQRTAQTRIDLQKATFDLQIQQVAGSTRADSGWTTQEQALQRVFARKDTPGFALALPWLLRLGLILLDLLPLATKLGIRNTLAEESIRLSSEQAETYLRSRQEMALEVMYRSHLAQQKDRLEAIDLASMQQTFQRFRGAPSYPSYPSPQTQPIPPVSAGPAPAPLEPLQYIVMPPDSPPGSAPGEVDLRDVPATRPNHAPPNHAPPNHAWPDDAWTAAPWADGPDGTGPDGTGPDGTRTGHDRDGGERDHR